MAATYNWSYKPNVPNKYNVIIPITDDNVRPAGFAYIAPWGNDDTGNGSRQYPYRSFKYVYDNTSSFTICILGSGVYREDTINDAKLGWSLIGDGNVIMDGTTKQYWGLSGLFASNIFNITFKNYIIGITGFYTNNYVDCKFIDIPKPFSGSNSEGNTFSGLKNTLIKNANDLYFNYRATSGADYIKNCTIINSNITVNNFYIESYEQLQNVIFYNCRIKFQNAIPKAIGCLFYDCEISIDNGTTYKLYTDIADLEADIAILYPTEPKGLFNCLIADPKFNNLTIDDYTLAIDSPAKNLSYFGTYVGAYSITKALGVKSDVALSSFDNDSAVNLNISDNSLTLIDVDEIASIVTKPIDNTMGREIQKLHTFGFNADRNGEYVDSTADLSTTVLNAGESLNPTTPYLVEIGSITYGSNVYNAGQRFTSSPAGGTFTTSTEGALREIIEAPARENVEGRFSDGALTTVDNTGSIEELAWYFVESDSVSYNGNEYPIGSFLKVLVGITSFTGSGLLRKVFSDSDTYFFFEINQKPTSNNVGNSRTGDILKGNGDKDFDRTGENVFPISKKFIQLKYTIQVDNLTP